MWQAVCRKFTRLRGRKRGELIEGPWRDNLIEQRMREIAERYEASNAHDRLALWLQHRDLRPLLSDLEKQRQG